MGLQKDLCLTRNQDDIGLTMFFISYVLFEIPSNALMTKLTPHVWRTRRGQSQLLQLQCFQVFACIVVFGIAMLARGFCKGIDPSHTLGLILLQ